MKNTKHTINSTVSTFSGKLTDQMGNSRPVPIEVTLGSGKLGNGMMSIAIEGYGDKTSADGNGSPILIENYGGRVRVIIWGDINQEDPTHVIELDGALESKRVDE